MHTTFPSGTLILEGDVRMHAGGTRGAVICHPHPQYGGDMDNPVVRVLADALYEVGWATLRFNFRGVGGSRGGYGGGVGEADDVRAAIDFFVTRGGIERVLLAGYSFGAMLALQVGAKLPAAEGLIAVAPPLSFASLESVATCAKSKLFIVGDRDEFCDLARLSRQLERVAGPKALRVIRGADHFLFGQEAALAEAVRTFAAPA
jgi:hypothetical protein